MKKKINIKNIIKVIESIVDHNYFKIVSISIITCFLLFNGVSYFKNSFFTKQEIIEPELIKINIGNFEKKLEHLEDQIFVHRVHSGETLSQILYSLGADQENVNKILASTKKIFDPRDIAQDQKLIIYYKTIIDYENPDLKKNLVRKSIISRISLSPNPEIDMIVNREIDGTYSSTKTKKELVREITKYSGKITNSLFVDGIEVGISPNIMIEMINLYGFVVDFQRDIRGGDKFEILYEQYYDKKGNKIKDGNILYSNLELKTKRGALEAYLHKYKNRFEYFNSRGTSIKRSLLATPINGARISSGFGMRRHPIKGYRKKHKGLDFAAPRGTPILAAGNGKISKIGYNRFNGNYIFLRHNKTYETVYIHMSKFARSMRKNKRVRQGQIIGYVGTTGRSTGPHLHYEVKKHGVSINPAKFKGTANITLRGKSLKSFKTSLNNINKLIKDTALSNLTN